MTQAEAVPEPLDLVTALLGEVGFMRSCIASGERLSQADLDRQNAVMARATKVAAEARSVPAALDPGSPAPSPSRTK